MMTLGRASRAFATIMNIYIDFLKYSHLQPTYNNINIETSDKATQFPDIVKKSTQTINKEDKGVDTGDDLNTIVGDYILHLGSKNFDRNEKLFKQQRKS